MHSAEDSDAELLAQLRRGDADALTQLMRRYYLPLAEYAMVYVASNDAADDVVQSLFIKVWDRRDTLSIHGSVRSYLYTATRNAALNAVNASRARQQIEAGQIVDDVVSSVEYDLEAAELAEAIAEVVNALPLRCRDVFVLARDHGLSYNEIAHTLGITPSTVRNQIAKAMGILEHRLAPFLLLVFSIRW